MSDADTDQQFLASEDVSQFIGKNAAYYQGAWAQAAMKAGSLSALLQLNRPAAIRNRTAGWNWAAFFFSIGWLMYRKMFGWAMALLAAMLVVGAVEEYTGKDLRPVYLTLLVMSAFYGNAWYLGHTHKRVTEIQKATSDAGARKLLLSHAGGTNLVSAVIGFLSGALIVIALSVPNFESLLSAADQVSGSTPAAQNVNGNTNKAAQPDVVSPSQQSKAVKTEEADKTPQAAPSKSDAQYAAELRALIKKNSSQGDASENPKVLSGWAPWLAELNGVWRDDKGGDYQIHFSPRIMVLKTQWEGAMPIQIIASDSDHDAVTFNVSARTPSTPRREVPSQRSTLEAQIAKLTASIQSVRQVGSRGPADDAYQGELIRKYQAQIDELQGKLDYLDSPEGKLKDEEATALAQLAEEQKQAAAEITQITIRRIWNDAHTGFNLGLFMPHKSVGLAFMRELLPDELAALIASQASAK